MHIGEQRRTIYIEPIDEPLSSPDVADPVPETDPEPSLVPEPTG